MNWLFFTEFFKKHRSIGSAIPSSKYLVEKMLGPLHFDQIKVLVELGPGTGVMTTEILKKLRADAKLLAFEINENFYQELQKIKDPKLELILDSAESLPIHMEKRGIKEVDAIVCSIPLAILEEDLVDQILKAAHAALKPGGTFVQFQYSTDAEEKLRKIFSMVEIDFTPLNIPPAFVFVCRK